MSSVRVAPAFRLTFLTISLVVLAMVACTENGGGSTDEGSGQTDRTTTGATGASATGGTGGDTGSTGGTGGSGATDVTGGSGAGQPAKLDITLNDGCSLQANPTQNSVAGPYLLVFEIHAVNVGGPYEAETVSFFTDGQPPLTGLDTTTIGYQDEQDVPISHPLQETALGSSGIITIETVGTRRGLSVSVPDGLGPAPCHL
jgi:hypothetical protein